MSNSPSTVPAGNIKNQWVIAVTLSPSSVANATSAEQTFTVTGLLLGDFVEVSKPSQQNGLSIANTRVSAADTLAIAFSNATAATITPTASEAYTVLVSRPEHLTSSVSRLTFVP